MKYTIIGAEKSGLAAAILASNEGNEVFLTESKPEEKFSETIHLLKENKINYEFGGNTEKALIGCDCIISSPGVPPTAPIIIEAEKRKIPIISELEFGRRHLKNNPLIAITGTNGKTTTTTLITYIFQKCGKKVVSAGNIGIPLSALVGKISEDTIIVAEVSSFQLDRIDQFRPDVAIILNITPDHLYYHQTMEKYIEAKFKIFSNQIEKDLLILNLDDDILKKENPQTRGKIAYFSYFKECYGAFRKEDILQTRFPDEHKEEIVMLLNAIRIPGMHNGYNSMAAVLAARAFEIRNEDIRDCLTTFEGVEHRLEFVRNLDMVDYINDSKATNVNATWYALSSYKDPIVWLAGGRADMNDYSLLDAVVKKNVKCIVCFGEDSENIFNHFCTTVRCIKARDLDEAVQISREQAEMNDKVLFTPACKSFDMFMNFEHRGECFKEIVNNLK